MDNDEELTDILIEDVIHVILRFLDIPSLQTIRLVNSAWNSLALVHLNKRMYLNVSKGNFTNHLIPPLFKSLGGPVSSFDSYLSIEGSSSQVFSSVSSLNLTLSPPTDKSINIFHKVLCSMVNLRDLTLTIFEWGNSEDTHFVKSTSIAQNFYSEVPPMKNLTYLQVQGTLGAYSAYLTARLIKSTTKLKVLSLSSLKWKNQDISDRNNSRLWLYNWLLSNPHITSNLESFTWSPFNLCFEDIDDSSTLNTRNMYLKKFSGIKSLQFGNKLRKLKWHVPFCSFDKERGTFHILGGMIPKSLNKLIIQDFPYCSELVEDDSTGNQMLMSPPGIADCNANRFVIFNSSMNNLTHVELDENILKCISVSSLLKFCPNLLILIVKDSKMGSSQFLAPQTLRNKEIDISQLLRDEIVPHKRLQALEIPFCARNISDVLKLQIKFPSLTNLSVKVKESKEKNSDALIDKFHLLNIISNCKAFKKLIWLNVDLKCSCNEAETFSIKCEVNCCKASSSSSCFLAANKSCKSIDTLLIFIVETNIRICDIK